MDFDHRQPSWTAEQTDLSSLACCDFFPHPEASSSSHPDGQGHHSQCPQENHSHPHTYLDPAAVGKLDDPCAFDAYCCHDEYCEETDGAGDCCEETECGKEDACCEEPACDVIDVNTAAVCGTGAGCLCSHPASLQDMVCSGMDCQQIEQYLDCCHAACLVEAQSSPNGLPSVSCNAPAISQSMSNTPAKLQKPFGAPTLHPSPNAALISLLSAAAELGESSTRLMAQSQAQAAVESWQPMSRPFTEQNEQPSLASQIPHVSTAVHICHWANCHQSFSTIHALLTHLSDDHLSSNATAVAKEEARVQAERQKQIEAETNQLLACLWDDCLPLPSTAHAFDPSRMDVDAPVDAVLRHVLNDHLGGPACFPEQISGPGCVTHAQIQPQNTPPTPQLLTPSSVLSPVFSAHDSGIAYPSPNSFESGSQALGTSHARTQSTGFSGAIRQPPVSRQRAHPHSHAHSHQHVHLHQHSQPHIHAHDHAFSHIHTHSRPHPHSHLHPHPHLHKHAHAHGHSHVHRCKMPNCSLTFPDTASLTEHISDDHVGRGMRTYTCEWEGCCGDDGERKVFTSRQKISRHLQSHTGHKPFICEICDQAFSEAAPLTAHMRRHSKEKPYKCTVPGCDKAFSIAASLTIHLRTHRGEKPFVCPHCNKGFVEASNLTKHIRTHTGERPFPCLHPGCGKRFSRPDQLKRHGIVHGKHQLRSPDLTDTARTSRNGSVSRSSMDGSDS